MIKASLDDQDSSDIESEDERDYLSLMVNISDDQDSSDDKSEENDTMPLKLVWCWKLNFCPRSVLKNSKWHEIHLKLTLRCMSNAL